MPKFNYEVTVTDSQGIMQTKKYLNIDADSEDDAAQIVQEMVEHEFSDAANMEIRKIS